MKTLAITLIVFGIIIIVFPAILAILLGGFFIVVGINILIFFKGVRGKNTGDNYVKFGNYKIFR